MLVKQAGPRLQSLNFRNDILHWGGCSGHMCKDIDIDMFPITGISCRTPLTFLVP